MLSTKKILSVGVGIVSMAGVMAMSSAPVVAAEGTIEVVTHAGAGGGTDVNSRMMMIRTRRHLKQDMVCLLYTSPSPRDGLLSRMPSSA